jgi:hypothetical protein
MGASSRYKLEEKMKEELVNHGLYICENGYMDFPVSSSSNKYCLGYFQSEKYFEKIKDKIKEELRAKEELKESLSGYVNHIKNSESVCLSIRMGDYINNPVLGVCTEKYYQNAIDKMYQLHPNATMFVFSDDIEGVKKKFKFLREVEFEPEGNNEWEKLTYMSMCRHFILSNSSFSWWTQYLSSYQNKTVIAPKRWFATDIPCDIYEKNWILLDV